MSLPEIAPINQNTNQNQNNQELEDDLNIYIDNEEEENINEFDLYFKEKRLGRQVNY